MGKPNGVSQKSRPKGLSKYAQKLARRLAAEPAKAAIPSPIQETPATTPDVPGIVTATLVEDKFVERGFGFLETPSGMRVFLGLSVLKRDCGYRRVRVGYLFECKIEDAPNGKGPRVKRISLVTPA